MEPIKLASQLLEDIQLGRRVLKASLRRSRYSRANVDALRQFLLRIDCGEYVLSTQTRCVVELRQNPNILRLSMALLGNMRGYVERIKALCNDEQPFCLCPCERLPPGCSQDLQAFVDSGAYHDLFPYLDLSLTTTEYAVLTDGRGCALILDVGEHADTTLHVAHSAAPRTELLNYIAELRQHPTPNCCLFIAAARYHSGELDLFPTQYPGQSDMLNALNALAAVALQESDSAEGEGGASAHPGTGSVASAAGLKGQGLISSEGPGWILDVGAAVALGVLSFRKSVMRMMF